MNIEQLRQQLGADIVKTCDNAIVLARNHRIIKKFHPRGQKMLAALRAVEEAATELKKDIEKNGLAQDPIGTIKKFEDLKDKSLEIERLINCEKN